MIQSLNLLSSSIGEWWDSVYNTYFGTDSYSYEHIGFAEGSIVSLRAIILGILLGFFIACCITIFNRRVLGDFVRYVIKNECLSREHAMTLEELEYSKNTFIRGALKSGVSLRRVVKCVEEEDFVAETNRKRAEYEAENAGKKAPRFREPKFKMDLTTMHFYIPEDLKYMADTKFEKKGANVVTLILAFLGFLVIGILALLFIPDLLQMLDNTIGSFDWKENVVT